MIRMTLPIAKPVAHDARPAYELSSATTTGMSAPPIGSTSRMPNSERERRSSRRTPTAASGSTIEVDEQRRAIAEEQQRR